MAVLKTSTPAALKKSLIYRMSGLIVTAKAYLNRIKKIEKECREKKLKAEYGGGVYEEGEMELRVEREYKQIADDFRVQCKLAVMLRDIALEEGLIKNDGNNGTPKLEDSPVLSERYALITIRPADGTCLVWFETAVASFLEHRPWVLGAEYHFEQTGDNEDDLGNGFHVHMVVRCKKSIRATEILKDVASDFECKYSIQIGNKRNKFLKTERDLEYALNYVRGDKHDESKEAAIELNDEWRTLNGLQDAYYVKDWDNRESRPDAVIIEEVV